MAASSLQKWLKRSDILWLLLVTMMPLCSWGQELSHKAAKQWFEISKANITCATIIANVTRPSDGGVYCEPVWDNLMCWPNYVKAGQNVTQPCPEYIQGFNHLENAVRSCREDGTWEEHPSDKINTSWTDFGKCIEKTSFPVPAIIEEHMPIITQVSTVGYSISLGTLIVATLIMVTFKKLHCQRNTIHINLFISFIFRAVISLLRNTLLVRHFALPSDIKYAEDGTLIFIQEGSHWECKLLNTLWQYSLNANYMWIFVEGLYLHTLIFFAVFSQSKRFFKLYILIGWVLPLIFIITWVLVRATKDDTLCWNIHQMGYYWILNAPIVSSISINFFFFLNIIRVLFTKIRDCNTRDPRRYRKLAKSTLVLIPLFGVYYIFFIVLNMYQEPKVAVVVIYMEMTLNSFQGTVVALLFCFLNGEVRAEIQKKWHRHWLRRQSVVSGRSSRALSTSSFYIGRDRASLSLAVPLCDMTFKEEPGAGPHQPPLNNNNNARAVRKVSSMPKISHNSPSTHFIRPIPRVSSTSKVTFMCTKSTLSPELSAHACTFDMQEQKTESQKICNGNSEAVKTEDASSLVNGSLKISDKNCKNVSRFPRPSFKWVQLWRNARTLKYTSADLNKGCKSNLSRPPIIHGLAPLSDVEEELSERSTT